MNKFFGRSLLVVGIALVLVGVFTTVVQAIHSWGPYHWARTANPFAVKLGDSVSSVWDPSLVGASNDWSLSAVLDAPIVTGQSNPRNCRAVLGRVEVCNAKYGANGWLGIASIWVSGDHIAQGTVKLNDTYFNTAKYNTSAWRNFVLCQEVGHTFGLNHQDEDFYNAPLGTCMDYTSDPTPNQQPNQHDYDQLETIYTHLDTVSTLSATKGSSANADNDTSDPSKWGKVVRKSSDGRSSLHERDLGKGNKLFTFVVWAD